MEHVESIGGEIYTLNSEMAAAASLAAMYFDSKTRQEVGTLQKVGFWSATDEQRQSLIAAMASEVSVFPQ